MDEYCGGAFDVSFSVSDFFVLVAEKRKITVPDVFPVEARQVSGLSVVASLSVVFSPVLALVSSLFLDFLDGVVARSKNSTSYEGGLIDWASDRYSEFIIFGYLAYLFNPFLLVLPVVNVVLNNVIIRGRKVYILPLRQILFVYLCGLYFF
ncbi:MAG: CDP-alcohol phosphatidyltransferase family protein [Candidatus Altiarchaeota archaeon]